MKPASLTFLAAVAAFACLFAPSADAQVVIYELEFEEMGESINYRTFDKSFFVMPLTGGNATFVLRFTEGLSNQFVQVVDFGVYFIATQGAEQKAVLANADAADGGTPVNTFNMIGDLNASVTASVSSTDATTNAVTTQITTATLADTLIGFILTTDSTTAGVFDRNAGSAGTSKMTATLNRDRTDASNNAALTTGAAQTVTQAVTDIVAELTNGGETEFVADPTAAEAAAADNANANGGNATN